MVLADINEQDAQESAEKSKKFAKNPHYRAIAVKVDVANEASVQAMVDTAVKEFGRIDYSVNSAGVSTILNIQMLCRMAMTDSRSIRLEILPTLFHRTFRLRNMRESTMSMSKAPCSASARYPKSCRNKSPKRTKGAVVHAASAEAPSSILGRAAPTSLDQECCPMRRPSMR